MGHCPGGNDDLFDPDRPLGTFSAKITLAYRLGLVDDRVEKCLQLIRKIRNGFAHATTQVSLAESAHRNRLSEITKCVQEIPIYPGTRAGVLSEMPRASEQSVSLIISLILLTATLEVAASQNEQARDIYVAHLQILQKPKQ
jgi:DNA-binding MltR family transcriptional regulator